MPPPTLDSALGPLLDAVREHSPATALVLYGSAARGDWRPGSSDINVCVVTADSMPASFASLATPLRDAARMHRVDPFVVARPELPDLARLFPVKLLDIRLCHRAVLGDDPFASLQVDSAALRARLDLELANHALRFRRSRILAGSSDGALVRALVETARVLGIELEGLLYLRESLPPELTRPALRAAAAATLGLDRDTMERLAALRLGGQDRDLAELAARAESLLGKMRAAASAE
jgi:predicted nucleotidyltransferase